MATDNFSELWEQFLRRPKDQCVEGPELREVVEHFYESGRAFAQTEIRQKAIAEAAGYDQLTARGGMGISGSAALRTFAAGLIGLKEGS